MRVLVCRAVLLCIHFCTQTCSSFLFRVSLPPFERFSPSLSLSHTAHSLFTSYFSPFCLSLLSSLVQVLLARCLQVSWCCITASAHSNRDTQRTGLYTPLPQPRHALSLVLSSLELILFRLQNVLQRPRAIFRVLVESKCTVADAC